MTFLDISDKRRVVGLPRGFACYLYPDFFETFFKELGVETLVSPATTQAMMDAAAPFSETEHCLSHKIFDAHLLWLLDRAKDAHVIDAIFIPRVLSMTKKYICCAKFGAVPDASRRLMETIARKKDCSAPDIITVDLNESREPLEKTMLRFARDLGAERDIAAAAVSAAVRAMDAAYTRRIRQNSTLSAGGRFLLIGHSYNLEEPLLIEPVLKKIRALGITVEVMTFERRALPFKGGFSPFGRLFSFDMPSPIRWCSFAKTELRLKSLDTSRYAGVIQIGVFNCGPDSIMTEIFRGICASRGIPFLALMLDGHSGSAGLETRIEAFADSLEWQGRL